MIPIKELHPVDSSGNVSGLDHALPHVKWLGFIY